MTRRERREEEAEARAQRGGREGAERGETRSDGETMTVRELQRQTEREDGARGEAEEGDSSSREKGQRGRRLEGMRRERQDAKRCQTWGGGVAASRAWPGQTGDTGWGPDALGGALPSLTQLLRPPQPQNQEWRARRLSGHLQVSAGLRL